MKKVIIGVMLLLGIGMGQAHAQIVSFGVKAEGNLSNFIIKKMPGADSELGFGATVGGFAKLNVSRGFALQPELQVHYQSSKFKQSGKKRSYEYFGLEIPVYAMGEFFTRAGHRYYIGLGPYIGFGLSAKFDKPKEKLYKNDALQRFDFGGKAMIGYEFANGIQINASYRMGLIDMVDKGQGKLRNQAISLGVGYRF